MPQFVSYEKKNSVQINFKKIQQQRNRYFPEYFNTIFVCVFYKTNDCVYVTLICTLYVTHFSLQNIFFKSFFARTAPMNNSTEFVNQLNRIFLVYFDFSNTPSETVYDVHFSIGERFEFLFPVQLVYTTRTSLPTVIRVMCASMDYDVVYWRFPPS